jgi:hypothetical protein
MADTSDIPVPQATVHLDANTQHTIRPTHPNGQVQFGYLDIGTFSLSLPQFPNDNWAVCIDTICINPDTFPDTIRTTFLLTPLTQCPDLSVDLGLPAFFRGCLATSPVQVKVTNLGTITAEDVQVALVMPFAAMELVSSMPPVAAQNGDTLFFSVGDLPALEFTSVNLTVKTRCDTFLLDQSLCLEAFANMSNPCPSTPVGFSEIRVHSECLSDTTVRFTLKNVGIAPTQALHEYVIIEDEVILKKSWFTLIIFDFNPPIITNTVFYTIGELLVSAEEPQLYPQLWQIMNNPMKSSATFQAEEGIRGEKQFDLIDTGGRIMYSEKFYDQEFTFERGNFGSGLYFFRIVDDKGRVFSGKVVISE